MAVLFSDILAGQQLPNLKVNKLQVSISPTKNDTEKTRGPPSPPDLKGLSFVFVNVVILVLV